MDPNIVLTIQNIVEIAAQWILAHWIVTVSSLLVILIITSMLTLSFSLPLALILGQGILLFGLAYAVVLKGLLPFEHIGTTCLIVWVVAWPFLGGLGLISTKIRYSDPT